MRKNEARKWTVALVLVALFTWGVIAGVLAILEGLKEPVVYTGPEVTVTVDTDHYLMISSETVRLQAASDGYFVVHKPNGESIVPQLEPAPLGWTADYYFSTAELAVPGGKWLVELAQTTINIKNTDGAGPVEVTVLRTDSSWAEASSGIGFLALLVWIFGTVVIAAVVSDYV